MLYVTTRTDRDTYTAFRALREDRAPDGGFFVPMNLNTPLNLPGNGSFHDTVAAVLNFFFNSRLTGWDVEFAMGRNAVQLKPVNHRIVIAEMWHNPEWCFDKSVLDLFQRIHPAVSEEKEPGDWTRIAVRVAALFGIYAELSRTGSPEQGVDISVAAEDLHGALAAWYAKELGLPVENIVCSFNANAAVWELIHQGVLHTDLSAVPTATPLCDLVLPKGLERLAHLSGGREEVERFLHCVSEGTAYRPAEEAFSRIHGDFYASVIGEKRLHGIISNLYKTNNCVIGPYGALAYAGIMDCRAVRGQSRTALVISERSPLLDGSTVCAMMGISPRQLETLMNQAQG